MIVGATNRGGAFGAFVWTAAIGKRDLLDVLAEAGAAEAVAGWTIVGIAGLSDDGRVVAGTARDADGRLRAFRAALPASP